MSAPSPSRSRAARSTSRRRFLKQAAAGLTVPWIVNSARIASANDRLHIAGIGVGGKGRGDLESTSRGQNVVAICDVDERTLGDAARRYPGAAVYRDWRRMLDERKDIDAVTVSTPDHMHAPIAASAMQLGKHVYVQKPLAHTVYEARRLRELATQHGVVSQMGNQGHSGSGYRTLVQLIRAGAIGKVREAHAWSNRPIWPQGIDRPSGSSPVPEHLHWDLWLGVAPFRPYVETAEEGRRGRGVYHPFNWRGWLDFGVGALGDMGCHIIDPVVWSLELAAPLRVTSTGPAPNNETFPTWETIRYDFAATPHSSGDSVSMTWYDGGKRPDHVLAQLPDGAAMPDNGCLLIGEKGVLLCPHGGFPMLLPEKQFADVKIERLEASDHYQQWTQACLGKDQTTSHFDYSGPLTETVLLGTIAVRFPQQTLDWDSEKLAVTNVSEANRFVHHEYREGWSVASLTR
jgi:predicted dehydrogenase